MVAEACADDWIALRAPALYGPRDLATLPFFKVAQMGWSPEPAGAADKRLSILFVEDMAEAVVAAAREAQPGIVYEVGDDRPNGHSWLDLAAAAAAALGRPVRRVSLPYPALLAYGRLAGAAVRAAGGAPMVTAGKIGEMFHADWVARTNLLADATSWRATTSLNEGFAKTVRWYQERGLLKRTR